MAARKKRRPRRGFTCPHCGAEVPPRAAACPDCGSDDETGWSSDAQFSTPESPSGYEGDEFDYDEFVQREFPDKIEKKGEPSPMAKIVGWIGLLALGIFWMWYWTSRR